MSRLEKAWKYPWILAGRKMSAFIIYPERRTHQDADILPPFVPSRQMWTVLAEPRYLRPPAVKPDKRQAVDFLWCFQIKAQTLAAHCVCFYCGKAPEDT